MAKKKEPYFPHDHVILGENDRSSIRYFAGFDPNCESRLLSIGWIGVLVDSEGDSIRINKRAAVELLAQLPALIERFSEEE